MCLSIPAKITEILDENSARAEVNGVECIIATHLIEDTIPGDFVLIHTGYALQKIDKDEAISLIREIQLLYDDTDGLAE